MNAVSSNDITKIPLELDDLMKYSRVFLEVTIQLVYSGDKLMIYSNYCSHIALDIINSGVVTDEVFLDNDKLTSIVVNHLIDNNINFDYVLG